MNNSQVCVVVIFVRNTVESVVNARNAIISNSKYSFLGVCTQTCIFMYTDIPNSLYKSIFVCVEIYENYEYRGKSFIWEVDVCEYIETTHIDYLLNLYAYWINLLKKIIYGLYNMKVLMLFYFILLIKVMNLVGKTSINYI